MCLLIRLIRQAMCNDITLEKSCILHAAMKEALDLRTFVHGGALARHCHILPRDVNSSDVCK